MLKLNKQRGFYSSLNIIRKRKFQVFSLLYQEERNINISDKVPGKWETKIKFWMRKYEDLFGITKLSEEHEKVLEAQEKLQNTQEKRREVQEEIFFVQKKLQEMQDILHKTSMGDDMYISVVTQHLMTKFMH
ncbi:uncharacterized protein LOC118179717 [Stegodyphus dumicola]|uniref:uncharacterized protein LOC118179717 n=1 Tax=Stegodyphus dumicola TaxID=202533 RepID=UPI0015ABFBB4|nr:uncharacterized protein LOC118179717 [Stegodyphus dumicola]